MTGEMNIVVKISYEEHERIVKAKETLNEIYMALGKITSNCDCMDGLENAIGYLDMILEGRPVY